MAKIKQINAEGVEEEIDVVTPEEVAAQNAEKDSAHAAALAEKDAAFSALETGKKELEDKISKMAVDGVKDDHPNFKVLKEALGKKDEDLEALRTEINTDKEQRKQDAFDGKIATITKGDEELTKKIKLHLETTLVGMKDGTAAEQQAKLDAAVKLSSDFQQAAPGIMDNGIQGGSMGADLTQQGANTGADFSAKEKALGEKMGITAEDYKKYAGRVSKK